MGRAFPPSLSLFLAISGQFRKTYPVLKEHLQLILDTCIFTITVLTNEYLFPLKFDENKLKFKRRLLAPYLSKASTIGYINKKEKNIVTGDFIKNYFLFIR